MRKCTEMMKHCSATRKAMHTEEVMLFIACTQCTDLLVFCAGCCRLLLYAVTDFFRCYYNFVSSLGSFSFCKV